MRVGIDVGGTFTDMVLYDGETFLIVKVPTTPKSPADGVMRSLSKVDLRRVNVLVHATTLGTNMFLGQEGLEPPKVALLTTKGFRDVLEIGRQRRPHLYDPYFEKPEPLIRRKDRYEVEERIAPNGKVLIPLNESQLEELVEKLREYDIVVVSFINSYVNPVHEFRAKKILEKHGIRVVTSYEVDPEMKEYERTSTTVINATLMPMMSAYLEDLTRRLMEKGFEGRFYIMQSGGGISTVEVAIKKPAAFIESGPTAGAVAVAYFSKLTGDKNAIGFDMGGTTAKASTIVEHEPTITMEYEVGGKIHAGRIIKGSGYPVRFPFVDLAEVSAGGGTIAWMDEGGALRVGPMSAGADPGPACYGKSDKPTITDANLVLNRLGERLSTITLNRELAMKAIGKLSRCLGRTLDQTARSIIEIANNIMAKALRIVTVERGYDPSDFTMFVFGGAGPLHGVDLGMELGVKSVFVPRHPGVFSALGLLFADFRSDKVKSVVNGDVESAFEELERLALEEVPGGDVMRFVNMRYRGQAYEITLPWMGERTFSEFHRRHKLLYGFSSPEEEVEVVCARVTVIRRTEKPIIVDEGYEEYEPKPRGWRKVYFDEWIDTKVYGELEPGAVVEGPAVVEMYDSTLLIPPDLTAKASALGVRVCLR